MDTDSVGNLDFSRNYDSKCITKHTNKLVNKIPILRFWNFNDNWNIEKLDIILKVNYGKDYKNNEHGDIPVYGTGGLVTYTNKSLSNIKAIGIGRKGTINSPFILTPPFWTVDTLFYCTIKEGYNFEFVYQLFLKINFMKYNESTGVPSLSSINIKAIKVAFPALPEQEKIANFLTRYDKLIALQERKIMNLKIYKKGLLNKMLSCKKGKKPKFRFDEFKESWSIKKLGDICTITTGKLNANAMSQNGKYRFYTCAKDYYSIDRYAFDTEALLISGNGANVGYIHYYKGRFNAYQRTYVLSDFSEDIIYIKKYLENSLHYRIHSEKKEGNTPYIVLKTLTDFEMVIPKYIKEQKKISKFLTIIDDKITQEETLLSLYKQQKKGFLQKMFI